jgi:hypothetical protein
MSGFPLIVTGILGPKYRAFQFSVRLRIVTYDEAAIEFAGIDDSEIARQAFGRGLCVIDDRFVAAGSSPSTITLYDLAVGDRQRLL